VHVSKVKTLLANCSRSWSMMMSLESRQRPVPVSVLRAVNIAVPLLCLCSAAVPASPQHGQADGSPALKAQLNAVSELASCAMAQSASDPSAAPAAEAAAGAAHRSGDKSHHGMLHVHSAIHHRTSTDLARLPAHDQLTLGRTAQAQ